MTRVHHLHCGTMAPPLRRLTAGEGGWLERGDLVCHVLLLETDRDGLVLIGTGFGTRDVPLALAEDMEMHGEASDMRMDGLARLGVGLPRPDGRREEEPGLRRYGSCGG